MAVLAKARLGQWFSSKGLKVRFLSLDGVPEAGHLRYSYEVEKDGKTAGATWDGEKYEGGWEGVAALTGEGTEDDQLGRDTNLVLEYLDFCGASAEQMEDFFDLSGGVAKNGALVEEED